MTNNQFYYAQLNENKRHNYAQESETARHNQQQEIQALNELQESIRHSTAMEAETRRSNLAKEYENTRSNMAREYYSLRNVQESTRHNVATENVQNRSTDVNELLGTTSNRIKAKEADTSATRVAQDTANRRKELKLQEEKQQYDNEYTRARTTNTETDTLSKFNDLAWSPIEKGANILGKAIQIFTHL